MKNSRLIPEATFVEKILKLLSHEYFKLGIDIGTAIRRDENTSTGLVLPLENPISISYRIDGVRNA